MFWGKGKFGTAKEETAAKAIAVINTANTFLILQPSEKVLL